MRPSCELHADCVVGSTCWIDDQKQPLLLFPVWLLGLVLLSLQTNTCQGPSSYRSIWNRWSPLWLRCVSNRPATKRGAVPRHGNISYRWDFFVYSRKWLKKVTFRDKTATCCPLVVMFRPTLLTDSLKCDKTSHLHIFNTCMQSLLYSITKSKASVLFLGQCFWDFVLTSLSCFTLFNSSHGPPNQNVTLPPSSGQAAPDLKYQQPEAKMIYKNNIVLTFLLISIAKTFTEYFISLY